MVGQCVRDLRNVSICINHLECNYYFYTRNTCIAETREARGVGKAHKTSGMEGGGGENRRKLCSLGGRVSILALILECEMYLITFLLE